MDLKGDFVHFNIPVYIRWLKTHKSSIWEARARVESGENPKQVLYFRPEPKLLK